MKTRKFLFLLMSFIILSAGVVQAADPIIIGSVEPFSPPGSIAQGSEAVAGIELAIEMLNEQGGLLERPVKVQFEDTLGIPEKGRAAVEKLITKDKVPVVVGGNCDIGPNVCIMPATSIGDNVVISPFSEIENSVIGNDVHIGPGSIIQDSVISESCVIKGNFTACSGEAEVGINDGYHRLNVGAMLGVGCSLGSSVVAQPGVIVGNYSRIQTMKLISGKLPDRSSVF